VAGQPVRLTLYGRPDCHLCHDMATVLDELGGELGFAYDVVDVDSDPELAARYGQLIPVLTLGEETLCHFFLDLPTLRTRLATLARTRS